MNDTILLALVDAYAAGDQSAASRIALLTEAEARSLLNYPREFADESETKAVPTMGTTIKDQSLAGKDGKALASLMAQSERLTARTINDIVREAIPKYKPGHMLLGPEQQAQLAEALASMNSTANLLGRSRIRKMVDRVSESHQSLSTFADDPIASFQPIPVLRTPEEAVEYFLGLFPSLGIDPQRYPGQQRRKAFTLAASTNETLTSQVQKAIGQGLGQNRTLAAITNAIEDQLRSYGATGRNPQYAEMVARTNVNDSYQTGVWEEGREDDVKDFFPCWQYIGIDDHRTGEDHRPKIDKYYPAWATFAEVRGDRPYNCRCSMRWIDYLDWADLQRQGKQLETEWKLAA